jgi:carbon monoxide dehydrogenase subunit G
VSVLEIETKVDAPPDRVWKVVSDPRNLPKWDRRVAAVRGVPPEGLQPGTEYVTDMRFMGVGTRVRAKVLDMRPPEYAKVRLTGLLDAVVETWVQPLDGDGKRSVLRHRIDYRFGGGPLGNFAARALRRLGVQSLLRRGVESQKRQAEASS